MEFLKHGGRMGQHILSFDWSTTALGSPDSWPQSLRTTLSIVLNSKSPMILFWGKSNIVFYNDAYLPSLGKVENVNCKLGQAAETAWPLNWPNIEKRIQQVYQTGEPTWNENSPITLERNGQLEETYWTFGYNPVYVEDGQIGGILILCEETTEAVLSLARLRHSEQRFQNLVNEASIGIIVVTGPDFKVEVVNNSYGRLIERSVDQLLGKPIFSVIPEAEAAFKPVLLQVLETGEALQLFDHPYQVFNEQGETIEGYLNLTYQPYREKDGTINGIMVLCNDVSEQVEALRRVEESEQKVRSIIEAAPFPIGVYAGREMRIQMANQKLMDTWGKGNGVIGQLFSEVLPELKQQAIFEQLDQVYTSGKAFHAKYQRVDLVVQGELIPHYFNYSFTPLFDQHGRVYGIMNTGAEVTDLVLAKQQVEESEQRFRSMIQQAPVAMGLLRGRELVLEVANNHILEFVDRGPEIIGKKILDSLPELEQQAILDILTEVFDTGLPFKGTEVPVNIKRNNQLIKAYFDIAYSPLRENGKVIGILQVANEVTQQVEARNRLEQSQEELKRFKYMADLARDPLILMRQDGTFGYLNKRALEAWGYSEEEMKRIRVPDVDPIYQDELFSQVFAQAQRETIPQFETLHRHKNGRIYPVEINMGGLSIDGEPHLLAVARDITERKKLEDALRESEGRFRVMADAAPTMVWALEPDGSFMYLNKFAQTFLGVGSNDLPSLSWPDLLHPDDRRTAEQAILKGIKERTQYAQEVRIANAKGEYRWFMAKGTPSLYASGEMHAYVGSAFDITELKQAKESLEHKNEQLQLINTDLDNFIYTASHDLKAPISNIEGLLHALLRSMPAPVMENERTLKITGMMQDSVDRFKHTIASLTEVVKIQKEDPQEREWVDINEVVQGVLLDLEPMIVPSKAQIKLELENSQLIHFAEKNVRSVLYNLLSNAIKYRHPERNPVVKLTYSQNPTYHIVSIGDNGLGIAKNRISQLFTMFKRLHDHVEGTGIGLYIIKKMVENGGGKIEVDSVLGQGTTFRVYFPRN